MDYVACRYDNLWWVGVVESINKDDDIEVKFMHPHGPTRNFRWPEREDKCWIPTNDIICTVELPTTATGRTYNINEKDFNFIVQMF